VPQDQIQLNAFPLVSGRRSVYGSLTGAPTDGEDALAFRVLENIRPMTETFLLETAARAYACMMQDEAVPLGAGYKERRLLNDAVL
jgi:D-arabinose 1-dehydrogenase-like Zn-dependent alcohol dehydrogenase